MFGFNNTTTATTTINPVVMTGGYNSTMVEFEGVVIKMGQNKSQKDQLHNEGNIYSQLKGVEGIIPNVKLGQFKGQPALFMPHIKGAMDLGEFMLKYLGSDLKAVKSAILQTRGICRELWNKGLNHNDLHLGNVIISPDEKVYVIDFGQSQFGHGTDREWFDLVSQLAKSIGDNNSQLDRSAQRNGRKLFVWLGEINEIPLSQVIKE